MFYTHANRAAFNESCIRPSQFFASRITPKTGCKSHKSDRKMKSDNERWRASAYSGRQHATRKNEKKWVCFGGERERHPSKCESIVFKKSVNLPERTVVPGNS